MAVDFLNLNTEPPCGWKITWLIRGTPVEIEAESSWELVDAVRDRLRFNNEPCPENVEEIIFLDICSRCPDGWCKGVEGDKEWFSAREIWENGTKTLNAIASAPRDARTVDQSEADRRASVCVECPKNKRVAGCWPCVLAVPLFDILLPDVSTPQDDAIYGCSVCKCALKKKVHVRKELLATGLSYPPNCWMVEP